MRILALALFMFGTAASAQDSDPKVRLLSEDQAKTCKATGIVSHSKMAVWSVDKATEALLREALKKAEKKGANAAVMMPLTSNRNLYTVMLQTYECPAAD